MEQQMLYSLSLLILITNEEEEEEENEKRRNDDEQAPEHVSIRQCMLNNFECYCKYIICLR